MNGIEDRIAGFPESDGRDDVPVAVELEDAGVFGIVVGPPNSEVKEAIGIGGILPSCSPRSGNFHRHLRLLY